ncbi:hypothetical protein U9M48_027938 [Paspalum notatum var. saurae]|uniref:CCHC-type domain-containing protein n=1 Tax=Paspalum notatum var. saurae TaxID=547442 RepID=A0AAQ3TY65_PASNO
MGHNFLLSWLLWSLSKVKSSTYSFKSNSGTIRKRSVILNLWRYNRQSSPLPRIPWMLMIGFRSLSPSSVYCPVSLRGTGPGVLLSWQCNQPGTRSRGMSSKRLFGLTISRLASSSSSRGNFVHFVKEAHLYSNIDTDPRRAARLLDGFDSTLLTHLGHRYDKFNELVDAAIDMEHRLREADEDQRRKRLANTLQSGSSQRQRVVHRPPPRICCIDMPQQQEQHYGTQHHPSSCSVPPHLPASVPPAKPSAKYPCYKCEKSDHFSKNCLALR